VKPLVAVFALASAVLLGGCADEREQMTGQELGQKFQRGISGEGRIGPEDRSDDPYVRQQVPQTHP
jgi:hypothetical protein